MRYYGKVGYSVTVDKGDGIWEPKIVSRSYFGDVTRNLRRHSGNDKINDDIAMSNSISILADPFAYDNFMNIVYVEWMGHKWEVTNVEIQQPRLLLTVGSLYNG